MAGERKLKEVFITTDKIFSHLAVLYQWERGYDIFPITVEIHLTECCNNRCFYCQFPKTSEAMSLRDFTIVVKKLSQLGVKAIILSGGGEPTLHPQIINAISTIAATGMDSAIISNLLIGDEKLFTSILQHCTWCRISLDASNPFLYKKIRGVDRFEQVVFNIQNLVKFKRHINSQTTVGVQSVITPYNIEDIFDEIRLSAELQVDYIQIRPVETMPGETLIYSEKQYDLIMEQIERGLQFERKDFKILRSNKWDIINPYLEKREHRFSFCHAYMMIAAIDVRGDIYVCCHQIEKRNQELCYGNIIKESIDSIMARRKTVIKNLDISQCYLECRASSINRCLENLKKPISHANFL